MSGTGWLYRVLPRKQMTGERGFTKEIEVWAARESVVGQFNRLKASLGSIDTRPWRNFYAGQMCVVNKQLDDQLTKFGVEVKDGKT